MWLTGFCDLFSEFCVSFWPLPPLRASPRSHAELLTFSAWGLGICGCSAVDLLSLLTQAKMDSITKRRNYPSWNQEESVDDVFLCVLSLLQVGIHYRPSGSNVAPERESD